MLVVDNYNSKLIVLFAVVGLLFIVYALTRNENIEVVKTSHSSMEKLSIAIEEKLEKFFNKWGIFCASNPLTVLLAGKFLFS